MLTSIRQAFATTSRRCGRYMSTTTSEVASSATNILPAAVATSNVPAPITPVDTANMIIPPAEDPMLQLFTNMFTRKGHRQKAQRMTSRVLLYLHTFTRAPPLPLFRQAVLDAAPATKCASVRSGPKIIITPKALPEKTRIHLAIGAIMKQATKRGGQQIEEKIAREMLDILKGDSEVLKIKDRLHKEAFANRSAIRIKRS